VIFGLAMMKWNKKEGKKVRKDRIGQDRTG
jgi:hypothetical protein